MSSGVGTTGRPPGPDLAAARRMTGVPPTAEAVVIGGGILGAATAFRLSQAGIRPVILELGDTLGNLTTANASANVRVEYATAAERELIDDGLAFYADFAARTGLPPEAADIGYVHQGGLFATLDPAGPERLAAMVARQVAIGATDTEVVPGDVIRREYPWLSPAVTAAMVRPHDGWLGAVAATEALVRASGATVCLDTGVTGFRMDGGHLAAVQTSRGAISTRHAIVCTGPFASRTIGAPLPVRLIRRHRLAIGQHPLIPAGAPLTLDLDRGSYWRPARTGALLAWPRDDGSTAPPLSPVPLDPSFTETILRDADGVRRVSPFWQAVAAEVPRGEWELVAGQYDITPDGSPLIDELPDRPGIWVNAGYSGQGVLGAPSGARLLAELLTGARDRDANPFRLDRFPPAAPATPTPTGTRLARV